MDYARQLVPSTYLKNNRSASGMDLGRNISAASILAKVNRDAQMHKLHVAYPEYGFDRHKGYPTKLHKQKLKEHGPIPDLQTGQRLLFL